MAYLISEEAQDLLQDVKNFCEKEVVEQCKAYDVSGEWPKEIYDKAIVCAKEFGIKATALNYRLLKGKGKVFDDKYQFAYYQNDF